MNKSLAFVFVIWLFTVAVLWASSAAGTNQTGTPQALSVFTIVWWSWWLPVVVAVVRHRESIGPIFIVTLFLGWTGIGWIVALAMAAGGTTRKSLAHA